MSNHKKTDYGIYMYCMPLDGETLETIPFNMVEDFEVFNCTIKHKPRFHPKNPDMPYD